MIFLLSSQDFDESFGVLCAVMVINSVAVCSQILSLRSNEHCLDDFGVSLHLVRYAEWITSLPLLGFASVMAKGGILSTYADIGVVLSLFMTILFCLICQFSTGSIYRSVGLILLSCISYSVFNYCLYCSYCNDCNEKDSSEDQVSSYFCMFCISSLYVSHIHIT